MATSTSRISGNGLILGALAIGGFATATLTLAASAASLRATQNPLRISVVSLGADQVEVTITNTSRKTLRIPKWQLPTEAHSSDVFRVARDGERVGYRGAVVKRGVPTAEDFAILRAGRGLRTVVSLSEVYDLSRPGHYTVTYAAPLQYASLTGRIHLKQGNGQPMVAQSAPIQVALDQRATFPNGSRRRPVQPANPVLSDVLGISTVGCSATQVSSINQAVLTARTYSERAKGYLNAGTTGARYTTWFGGYSAARYTTAQQHFATIDTALDQTGGQVKINCGCTQNYYAYVYKNDHYQIYVCNLFWSAPLAGTDSKAGTLIHEMSHFTIVADTDDHAYGQSLARNLATNDPLQALDNADNHEYFAENTPFQN